MTVHFAPDGLRLQLLGRSRAREAGDASSEESASPSFGRGKAAEASKLEAACVQLLFEGASPAVSLVGLDRLPGRHNFFLGGDPGRWRTDVAAFGRVRYEGLYEGIDLVVREERSRVEYDVLLAPGADLGRLVLRVEGASGPLRIDGEGNLVVPTPLGEVLHLAPKTWEERPEGRVDRASRYRLVEADRFAFEVDGRDPSRPMVVDPGLLWSTYLGGANDDSGFRLVSDGAGGAIVAGSTFSLNFPTTPGAYDPTFNSTSTMSDVFVARLDPSQSGAAQLVWATYIGGSGNDGAYDVGIDPSGSVTVAGFTTSTGLPIPFPTTPGAYDPTSNGGLEAFVSRLSPSGNSLTYSTYLGGFGNDWATNVEVDPSGVVTLLGNTASGGFPTVNAYDPSFNLGRDLFVARLDPSQSGAAQLVWSTYLGGSGNEGFDVLPPSGEATTADLEVDSSGVVTLVGETDSPDFPTTPGAYGTAFSGVRDIVVSRLDPSQAGAAQLVWSTYLGGASFDRARGLEVDASGRATVVGGTTSTDYPVTPGAFKTVYVPNPPCCPFIQEGVLTRLDPSLSGAAQLVWSTFLGGDADFDIGQDLVVDSAGRTTVVGSTASTDFPTTVGAFQTAFGGGTYEAVLVRVDPTGSSLLYSTFFGGSGNEGMSGVAVDDYGVATFAGFTFGPGLPTTPGAYDPTSNGGGDVFLGRMDLLPTGADPYGASTPGCAGILGIGVASMPQVGNAAFAITCTDAPPSSPLGLLGLSPAGLASPVPILGVDLWIDPVGLLLLPAASNGDGYSVIAIPIPNDPSLAGGTEFSQFFWLGPTAPPPCPPLGVSASNALAITVQP